MVLPFLRWKRFQKLHTPLSSVNYHQALEHLREAVFPDLDSVLTSAGANFQSALQQIMKAVDEGNSSEAIACKFCLRMHLSTLR